MAIRGLLFDKDGTLFDFRATWGGWTRAVIDDLSGGDAARAHAVAGALGFDTATGVFQPDSPVIAHTVAEIASDLLPHLPGESLEPLVERLNGHAMVSRMVPAVELKPLFARFQAMGLKIGLATNDAEAPARAHLAQAGISDAFDFIAGFDSGWGGKPEDGQMRAFLAKTGLQPAEAAMVGDSLHDLDAGRAAGMRTVAVLTGIAPRDRLAPHADVVLDTIDGLPDWVSAQG